MEASEFEEIKEDEPAYSHGQGEFAEAADVSQATVEEKAADASESAWVSSCLRQQRSAVASDVSTMLQKKEGSRCR